MIDGKILLNEVVNTNKNKDTRSHSFVIFRALCG
jgi:hypothetical protein